MDALINSQIGLRLGLAIASSTPPRLGYAIAKGIATLIATARNSELVRGIRRNQGQISETELDPESLSRAVKEVLSYTACSFYDLYHHLNDLECAGELFVIEPSFQALIERPKFDSRGLVVAGLHMSGFDLAYQWLCQGLLQPLGVTIPDPQGGRAMEFQRRMEQGIDLVPGNFEGIRQAIRFLKEGGMVVTGLDRPNPAYEPRLQFFGSPACLPTHHTFLAIKTGCPVVVVASHLQNDGLYHLSATAPIEMENQAQGKAAVYRDESLRLNAEKVLATAETFIRSHPHQWLISQPVWV